MNITILVDNNVGHCDLKSEHGLSIYIETEKRKILFDTGKSDLFLNNAQKLNIDLSKVDTVVISHGHYDHLGGLISFLQINNMAKVYLKKEIFDYQYQSLKNYIMKEIGYPEELHKYKSRFEFLNSDVVIDDNLFFINEIENKYPLPKGNKMLYKSSGLKNEMDDFHHELIFIIDTLKGFCIFSGCAHNGVLNMIYTVKKCFPGKKVFSLFGGLHLIAPNEHTNAESNKEINNLALEFDRLTENADLYTGHCTSISAVNEMEKVLNSRLHLFYTGYQVEL